MSMVKNSKTYWILLILVLCGCAHPVESVGSDEKVVEYFLSLAESNSCVYRSEHNNGSVQSYCAISSDEFWAELMITYPSDDRENPYYIYLESTSKIVGAKKHEEVFNKMFMYMLGVDLSWYSDEHKGMQVKVRSTSAPERYRLDASR